METLKEYLKYASLNVLGMIGLSCYILADTFFVAKGLGSRGLAALNLAIPVYSFIHGSGMMLGMGGAALYSIRKGQGEEQKKNEVFSCTVVFGCIFAALFVAAGLLGAKGITRLLGADKAVFAMCETYLKVLLLFSPAFLANDLLLCFVRNDGAPQLSMAAMLTGSFANIILDYVFIFKFQMGILGAVSATGFAPVISMGILSSFFMKGKNTFHFTAYGRLMDTADKILFCGLPSLVAELSSGIVMIVFNAIMLSLSGNTGVAAYGIIANLSLVVMAVFTGIAQGIQPLASRYHGMGEKKRNRLLFRYGIATAVVLSLFIYMGMFAGANQAAAIFNSEKDSRLQEIAAAGIRLYFTAVPFAGFNIITAVFFSATDCAKSGNLISMLRGIVLIVPLAILMSGWFGSFGLWLSFPLTELLTAVCAAFLYHRNKNGLS